MKMASEVVENIAKTVRTLDPLLFLQADKLVAMDNDTLRFHFRRGEGAINVDVRYNYGKDLYEVKATKVSGVRFAEVGGFNDIFFDQLPDIINSLLEKGRRLRLPTEAESLRKLKRLM